MSTLTELFSQYSIETIILFAVGLGVAIKFIGELIEYFYNRVRKHFNVQNLKDQQHNEIVEGISETKEGVATLTTEIDELKAKIAILESQGILTTERLQENSRSYIIDKHHYFCYEVHAIDDLNLQSLERRYLYYKAAGGNSFIDGLMEEIRSLPRMNLQSREIINAIQHFGEIEKDTK